LDLCIAADRNAPNFQAEVVSSNSPKKDHVIKDKDMGSLTVFLPFGQEDVPFEDKIYILYY
jgi:hypothetical protein